MYYDDVVCSGEIKNNSVHILGYISCPTTTTGSHLIQHLHLI